MGQFMQYFATRWLLPAGRKLAALFEATSLVRADRNGLPLPVESMGVSHLLPSYIHVGA